MLQRVSAPLPTSEHRRDIDGLRALAILPVVAFHAGISAVRGGFVGVDVFFVISGYLITQVLLADIRGDRFSLVGFYERRIRRILPALLVVLAITFLVALAVSLPSELIDLAKSQAAAALSVSNFYFWGVAGYFDSPTLTKPLLHTWSLAVEEQFYVFWPLYLYMTHRWLPRHLTLVTALLAATSLLVSSIQAFTSPSASFYLVHSRAWELASGSLLALGAVPAPQRPGMRNALAALGLGLILYSCFAIDSLMPFPGLLAVPPCLGAVLIILAGQGGPSLVGRLISWRPIAFIGLISYSLYLWHWPVIVLQRTYGIPLSGQSEMAQKLSMIGCSLALAVLSWRFVEQPFRSGPHRPSRPALFRMAAAGTGAVLAMAVVGLGFAGFPARYSARDLQIADYLNYSPYTMFRAARCFYIDIGPAGDFAPECFALDRTRPNYLLLGDSHAAQLWVGLQGAYPNINFLQATASGCFPTLEHGYDESRRCIRLLDEALLNFLPAHRVDRVIFAARWKANRLARVAATLERMHQLGIPVTLVGPTVVYDSPLPRLLLSVPRERRQSGLASRWDRSVLELDAQMAALAAREGAQYVSLLKLLCSGAACLTEDGHGMPLLWDREHLTAEGSLIVARRLQAQGLWARAAGAPPYPPEAQKP